MKLNLDTRSARLLALLLLIDLAFVPPHVAFMTHHLASPLWSISEDGGYGEIFQYLKEFGVAAMLLAIAIRQARMIHLAWAALFVYFLLDDALQIHEVFGARLVALFQLQPMGGLKAQDLGELGVSAGFGALLFGFIGACYLFADAAARRISRHLFALVMLLCLFGVVVDMLHSAIPSPIGRAVWGLIEDGGEMVAMSLIVWYVFRLLAMSATAAVADATLDTNPTPASYG